MIEESLSDLGLVATLTTPEAQSMEEVTYKIDFIKMNLFGR